MMQNMIMTNIDRHESNQYPGRGIIIGLTPDSTQYVQVYWIMGRSENSRNLGISVSGIALQIGDTFTVTDNDLPVIVIVVMG